MNLHVSRKPWRNFIALIGIYTKAIKKLKQIIGWPIKKTCFTVLYMLHIHITLFKLPGSSCTVMHFSGEFPGKFPGKIPGIHPTGIMILE